MSHVSADITLLCTTPIGVQEGPEKQQTPLQSSDSRIENIIDYIHQHLDNDLSVRLLAQLSGLSLSHFRVLFISALRVTPAKYIKSLRMKKAANLLASERMTVKEAMRQVGISDKSHFMRDFKLLYGTTPGKYHQSALNHIPLQCGQTENNNIATQINR